MKSLFIPVGLFLSMMCLISCYPEGPEFVHEKDIALTYRDGQTDFSDYKTFVIPDSVVFIKSDGDTARIDKKASDQLIAWVKQNFTDRNYECLTLEEAESQMPDFVVTVTAFATSVFDYTTWSDYWGWYPGWSRFGLVSTCSGFYPWYREAYTNYACDKGSLSIDILDVRKADSDSGHIPVLWSGVSTGILAGSTVCLCDHLERDINQCFIQSPYLGIK